LSRNLQHIIGVQLPTYRTQPGLYKTLPTLSTLAEHKACHRTTLLCTNKGIVGVWSFDSTGLILQAMKFRMLYSA
jgi:hypothetical protein